MASALGLQVVEVPGDGNCFLHAARFALLQIHSWNYDLVPTHQAMQDVNGVSLDELQEGYIDLRQEPSDGTDLEPPRLSYYDTWDEWVTEMERPNAYVDNLFAQGLSYVFGVCIRLLCDITPEPLEFYLGPARPCHAITLTFRAGGMHYSATRGITTVTIGTTQTRNREKEFSMADEEKKKKKSKQGKQSKEAKGQKEKNKGKKPLKRNSGRRRSLIRRKNSRRKTRKFGLNRMRTVAKPAPRKAERMRLQRRQGCQGGVTGRLREERAKLKGKTKRMWRLSAGGIG